MSQINIYVYIPGYWDQTVKFCERAGRFYFVVNSSAWLFLVDTQYFSLQKRIFTRDSKKKVSEEFQQGQALFMIVSYSFRCNSNVSTVIRQRVCADHKVSPGYISNSV